ncbi:MAG: DUF2332 domain-containing protein [Acidimicrobiales bacterium]
MHEALQLQSVGCASLGSTLYSDLIEGLAADYVAGGITRTLLEGASDRPVHDATPLRLLGALHRLALTGAEPGVARHFPTTGGVRGEDLVADCLSALARHCAYVRTALSEQVQTNEVARSIVPLVLGRWLASLGVGTYTHLEVGASAGLNLNFTHYCADDGGVVMGEPASAVRFGSEWFAHIPSLPPAASVPSAVRGADPHPVDIRTEAGRIRLLSFIWPDQTERFDRVRAALTVAETHRPQVSRASADAWLAAVLPRLRSTPTMVFHSIVWQYLGATVQDSMRATLDDEGSRRSKDAPLVWARMEPAGSVADVRATVWRGDAPEEYVLAEIGYHGRDLRWVA